MVKLNFCRCKDTKIKNTNQAFNGLIRAFSRFGNLSEKGWKMLENFWNFSEYFRNYVGKYYVFLLISKD